MGLQLGERPSLVRGHEPAVADYVSREDRGQPAFHTLFAHATLNRRITEDQQYNRGGLTANVARDMRF